MSFAEIKKAVNSDLNKPLDILIKELLNNESYGLQALKSSLDEGADKPTLDYIKNKLSNFKIGGMSVVENNLEYGVGDYVNTSVSTLPSIYSYLSAVVYNNEIHILGGTSSSSNKKAHYKWSGSSWAKVSSLPYDFSSSSAVVYNNEIHMLGGSDGTNSYSYHYKWNGSSWEKLSSLPFGLHSGSAVVYNNEIHILGGVRHYKWDGSNWSNVSKLLNDYSGGEVVVYNNEIHMLGGNGNSNFRRHYKWNGSSWSSLSKLPYDFYSGCSAVVYNNEIHILGGYDTTKHYKWNGSSWSSLSTLPYHFRSGSAIVYNNEIHILGGSTYHYKLNEAYNKLSLYLLKNQKVYPSIDMSNITPITNCTNETSNILVTENGLTEFKVDTTDKKIVLTIKG